MAAKPTVGVTGNASRWSPSWWCIGFALWIAGAQAVRISVRSPKPELIPQGLIVSGGDDIGAEHYDGDVRKDVKVDTQRDKLELDWIRRALEQNIPMLGICRGAQLINVALGGNLHQDIKPMRRLTYNRRGLLPTKQVLVQKNSRLAEITGKTRLRVNSLHHQAIDRLGADLEVKGWDLDQITQAVEDQHNALILGVQWHPEYLFYLSTQRRLFSWLVEEANKLR